MKIKTTDEKGTHLIQVRNLRTKEPSQSITLVEPDLTVREIFDKLRRFLDAE